MESVLSQLLLASVEDPLANRWLTFQNDFVDPSCSLSLDEEDLYSDDESGGLVSIYWAVTRHQDDDDEEEDEDGVCLSLTYVR